jgi:hypothetical protein
VLRLENSWGGLIAGCRLGFARRGEHTCGSDGEPGQALLCIRSGGGDWLLWWIWRDTIGRMRACAEMQSGTEHQWRGKEEGGVWQMAG